MKTKSARILGVVITVMLLASLIVAIPGTASAGTQAWSALTLPSATGLTLANLDVTSVVVAGDGTIYAAAVRQTVSGTWAAGTYRLLKSTDRGKTFAIAGGTTLALTAGQMIISIVPSKQTPSRVYVAISDGAAVNQVKISADSGATFGTAYDIPAGTGNITSMDVTYGTSAHLVAVGTSLGALTSNVQILDESAAFPTWANNGDVTITGVVEDVAFSPNFKTDGMISLVGEDAANTYLKQRVSAGAWTTIGTFTGVTASTAVAPIPAATIAFSSDFDRTSNNITFVGLNQTTGGVPANAADDVYEVVKGAAAPIRLKASGTGLATPVASMVVDGPAAAATIVVGVDGTVYGAGATPVAATVISTSNTGGTWNAAAKQPTGGSVAVGSQTFVALATDFATSKIVYAGTSGNAAPGTVAAADESGFSISADGGATFNQRSLIDTAIAAAPAGINQILPVSGALFVVTSSAADSSVWRTTATTAGGDWWRILVGVDAGGGALPAVTLGASASFATDHNVWAVVNDTATPSLIAMKSTDADTSATFNATLSPITAASTGLAPSGNANVVEVLSPTSILIGDSAGNIISTTNNGVIWGGVATPAAAVTSMDVSGANILVGTVAGTAFISTNSGATFRGLGTAGGGVGLAAGATSVAFDPSYSSNSTAYAGSAAGTAVSRIKVGTSAATDVVATFAGWVGTGVSGITLQAGPTGLPATMYAGDTTAGNGATRSINPTATAPAVELTGAGTGLPPATSVTAAIASMQISGPNTLWIIDSANNAVRTFTDTLNIQASAGTAVATSPTTATVTWPAVPNATAYVLTITTPLGAAVPAIAYGAGANITSAVVGAAPGAVGAMTTGAAYTFTVSVAAGGPDASYASPSASLGTAPGAAPWDPTQNAAGGISISPAPGSIATSTTPTLQWNTSAGATGFELIVSTSPTVGANNALSTADVANKTGANAITGGTATAFTVPTALDNSKTYYWQVRAVLGANFSPWSGVQSFTTPAKPVAPVTTTVTAAPVTSTVTAPAVTVTQPASTIVVTSTPAAVTVTATPTTVTQQINLPAASTPAWVWAIIAIGGILLIVVIVLIARTRKV